jgi:hypothetical protein
MLITISKQSMDVDEEFCACFRELQNVFFRVKWTKLMHIPNGTGKTNATKIHRQIYKDQSNQ